MSNADQRREVINILKQGLDSLVSTLESFFSGPSKESYEHIASVLDDFENASDFFFHEVESVMDEKFPPKIPRKRSTPSSDEKPKKPRKSRAKKSSSSASSSDAPATDSTPSTTDPPSSTTEPKPKRQKKKKESAPEASSSSDSTQKKPTGDTCSSSEDE